MYHQPLQASVSVSVKWEWPFELCSIDGGFDEDEQIYKSLKENLVSRIVMETGP